MERTWEVGVIQSGPMHDAGLRFFVIARRFPSVPVAWTLNREPAVMIVEALEQMPPKAS
jgi:hypothetical protein